MLVTCVAIGLVCGTMGYIGARSAFFFSFYCLSGAGHVCGCRPWYHGVPGCPVSMFFSRFVFSSLQTVPCHMGPLVLGLEFVVYGLDVQC